MNIYVMCMCNVMCLTLCGAEAYTGYVALGYTEVSHCAGRCGVVREYLCII